MGSTTPDYVPDSHLAAIETDVRQQMNRELNEYAKPAERSILAQKYGLIAPVFTAQERTVIENRKKLEAKRSRRAGNHTNA